MLRSFVNRNSCTSIPPVEEHKDPPDIHNTPIDGLLKQESNGITEDSLSVSSHMSVDTIGSTHTIEEDTVSIGSASAYCTPTRNPLTRNGLRTSTRSVSDRNSDDDMPPSLFRSLCNSAVRRVPNSKNDQMGTPMRRSMRMAMQKRNLNGMNMADVPEEEEAVLTSHSIRVSEPILEEGDGERFGEAKEFFEKNVTSHEESGDEGSVSMSRLSTTSESRISNGSFSIGRKSSFLRKVWPGKSEPKERRLSDVFHSTESATINHRRASMVSFTNDCSFTGASISNTNVSVTSLASTDSPKKAKMRKKAPSSSNLTQRISSVFRRSSSSAVKDDDICGQSSSHRNTLTGFSSISSGIGSIASAASDQGYGTIGSRNGQSISRSGSKRDDENKRERTRRLLDRIIISNVPAAELLRMKSEQIKKRDQKDLDEKFETQLNDTASSTNSHQEHLNFDVVALDLKANGSPFSTTAASFIDEGLGNMVKEEIRTNYRPERCGSITDYEPEVVFVIPEQPQSNNRTLNDSISSNDVTSDLLRNVRSGLCKAIEEWKKITSERESSTMLIYPMFCQSEDEWDSKATIDALFLMLDGILMNVKRWRPNGKCILAGITPSNVQLLREKYDDLRQSVSTTEPDGALIVHDDLDTQSITSNSTMFGTNV
uniref:TLDc domain-containing protein n=1 Tax=Caenorhabditis tropicalis TaxID=1561998 RepID=A0A1I7T998_9PELO